MSRIFFILSLAFVLCVFPGVLYAGSDGSPDITGYWMPKKKDVIVHVELCEDGRRPKICGTIYWLSPDTDPVDTHNPDEDKAGRSLCGARVLWGMKKSLDKEGHWFGGRVYKPSKGETYKAYVDYTPSKNGEADQLRLHGYIGIPALGKTSKFTRVESTDYIACSTVIGETVNDKRAFVPNSKVKVEKKSTVPYTTND